MAGGILTVCFTAPKPKKPICPFTFISATKDWIGVEDPKLPIALGDFNNDNHSDIIVVQRESTNISIFFSYGNGSFFKTPIVSARFSSSPYSIAVGDFNQDNCLDIAVANHDHNNIGIFFGHGNGTFANEYIYSTGSSRPLSLSIHDLNNDKLLDIIVANDSTNNIGIFLGDDNGMFTNQMTFSTGFDSLPHAVAVGDFNNDNRMDIVVANAGTNNIGVFLANNNGTFLNQTTFSTDVYPISVAVGDFNNDTRLDIVVSNNHGNNIGIFLGNGNGTFMRQVTYATGFGSYPSSVAVCDCNRDNQLDVIVANSGNDNLGLLLGNGDGTFKQQQLYPISSGSPQIIVIEDLNNDTWMDIVFAIDDTYNVGIFLGGPDKNLTGPTTFSTGPQSFSFSVATGDFNNDTILDIVVVDYNEDDIGVFLGHGDGTFAIKVAYSTGSNSQPTSVAVGDFNNDNRLDIIVTNYDTNSIGIFLGNGNGTFLNQTVYPMESDSNPLWVAVGYFNNDTKLDIVVAAYGIAKLYVFLGNGDGSFSIETTYSTDIGPATIAIGDFNNDTRLDIAVANYKNATVGVFLGKGDGSFLNQISYPTDRGPNSIVVGDLNNDARLDIAVANYKSDNVGVFLGKGDGTFLSQTSYFTGSGSSPYTIAIGDLNDDNRLDLIVANYDNNNIGVLLGKGDGTLLSQTTYSTGWGSHPISVAVGDFNRDNRLDIVAVLYDFYSIGIFLGYYNSPYIVPVFYSSGSIPSPFALAVADFDNDTQLDIIATDLNASNVVIYLNSGNGTIKSFTLFPTGYSSGLYSVAVSDFNNDSRVDFVVANYDSDSIAFFFGFGNGSFGRGISYTTELGSGPCSVAVGDFNNDNRVDIINANNADNTFILFLHYGFGAFIDKQTYSTSTDKPSRSVAFGDFNQDTLIDMVTANCNDSTITVLLGNRDGVLSNQTVYNIGSDSCPYSVAVDDLNNDTRLDIVVASRYGTNNVVVLIGKGDGMFLKQLSYSTGYDSSPTTVVLYDFNNDSRLDIVVTNNGDNTIGVFIAKGDGTFSNETMYSTGYNSAPWGVAISDFNNDARPDIVESNGDGWNIGVFLANEDGTFSKQITYPTGNQSEPTGIAVGDFNNDNRTDIVVANYGADNIGVFFGIGNGSFLQQVIYSTGPVSGPYGVAVGDFNKDDRLDIAVTLSLSDRLAICFGDGNGTFSSPTVFSTGISTYPWYLLVFDFNHDNWLDIAVVFGNVAGIGVFLGDENRMFLVPLRYSTDAGSAPQAIVVSDFNNDKHLDVAITYSKTNNVGVFLGLGHGKFSNQVTYSTGINSQPWSIAVGDLNNDMQMDIVVTNRKNNNIGIFLGYKNGIFGNITMHSTGSLSDPISIAILDFNRDNKMDIVVANYDANGISIFEGNGDGTLSNQMTYLTGYSSHPMSVAIGDFNKDDWIDIVVATLGTKNVKILLKLC
ncbi:unnamed protein product [Rotaria sp. Silwood1]|nr:unnamed protein product [Rotaria sp. Silwood1]